MNDNILQKVLQKIVLINNKTCKVIYSLKGRESLSKHVVTTQCVAK